VPRRFALAIFVASLAAGCAQQQQRVFDVCPDIVAIGPPLLYPIPNATAVPTAAGYLIFAGLPDETDIATALLPTKPGSAETPIPLGSFGPAPSPLPSPIASSYPSVKIYGVAYPQLASKTKYTITYSTSSTAPCASAPTSSGSFTTE